MKTLFSGIVFAGLLFFIACKKDGKIIPDVPAGTTGDVTNYPYGFKCEDTTLDRTPLPPDPPFDWQLSLQKGNKSVHRVIYDPIDADVFYYVTWEEGTSPYTLWRYNLRTNSKTLLDGGLMGITINIHKNGWLVYEKMDLNIYKIKTNGDSLKQLTTAGHFEYPCWTDDGQYIYILNQNNVPNPVFKLNREGSIVDTLHGILSGVYSIKNYIYYLKLESNVFSMIQRDLTTQSEKIIHHMGCSTCYTDDDNTMLFTVNDDGLYKTDLSTLTTTKIIYSGENTRNGFYFFRRSSVNSRFIAIQDSQFVVNPHTLSDVYRIVEFSPDGLCRHKIFVP